MARVAAIHFNATDSHRMQEVAYLLILVAGVGLLAVPIAGRRLAGIALAIAGILLFAALRWGSG